MMECKASERKALEATCRIWGDHRFRDSGQWVAARDGTGIGRTQEEADDPERQVPEYIASLGAMALNAGELDSEVEQHIAECIASVAKLRAEQAAREKSQADALSAWMSRAYVMARNSDPIGFEAAVKRLVAAVAEHGPGYFATRLAEPAPDAR